VSDPAGPDHTDIDWSLLTDENLKVLCFEHHTQMRPSQILLRTGEKSERVSGYGCEQTDCLVRYSEARGYMVIGPEGSHVAGEVTPKVTCPTDGRFMYLAEVRPEQRSYRLWRCPECGKGLTNQELSQASNA
jgi:hypothetical protein